VTPRSRRGSALAPAALVAAAAELGACGPGDVRDPGASAAAVTPAQVTAALVSASSAYCDCLDADLVETCRVEVEQELPPFTPCETEALSASAAQPTLRCAVDAAVAFEACMAQASCEEAAIAVCEERLDAALGACVTSPSVSLALEQCLVASGESFVCANGEVVAESWICDGWDDCSDGSDEVGC